jgi:uncharacterized glyoxalase superfamily protein PhnB
MVVNRAHRSGADSNPPRSRIGAMRSPRVTYQTLLAKGVEFTQEPVEQPYGTDVGLRDPFGNHIRIVQLKD